MNRSYKEDKIMRSKTLRLFLTTLALVSLTMGASTVFAYPANDNFSNATLINALPFHDDQDLSADRPRRSDSTVPAPSCVSRAWRTVWYKFNGNNNWLDVNTFGSGSGYNSFIAVYRYEYGTLTQVACNDDTYGLKAGVSFFAQTGNVYYIMVGGTDDDEYGDLDFCVDIWGDLPCT
jgi:hypothetical protein